ncbi:MAG: hypothetical protein ILP12_00925 [Lachnospiraceae bacterium]|nr:hypothetical protein [Lachnospiraceae bacterium]
MKCPYCGSEEIETGIAWGKASEIGTAGYAGLKYNKRSWVDMPRIVPVYSDLCLRCGTIVRSYIRESTGKNWTHE